MDKKEDIQRYIDEIANSLINNNATVMVGSGFSKNAKKISYDPEQQFCDWNQLADKFYKKLFGDIDTNNIKYYNPLALAEEVETIYGRPVLEEILKDSIPDNDYIPDDIHNNLLSLSWKDVFTTNYDTLLERAAENIITTNYNVINCKEDLVNSSSIPRIIKLHGSFPSHRPFIITEEDYRRYPSDFAPFVNTVQQSLIENTFCMIGFSCDDPNFLRWIGWMNDHLGKNHAQNMYMISLSGESEAKKKKLSDKNIRLINLDTWSSKDTYYEKVNEFILYLKNKIDENKRDRHWCSKEDVEFFRTLKHDYMELKELNLDICISKLNELRKVYPGWITLPESQIKNTSYVMDELYDILLQLKKEKKDYEIDFIYEYVLFKQMINMPILREDGCKIIDILDRNIDNEKENWKDEKYQTILLQILRFYRENSMINEWNETKGYIDINSLNYEQSQFWNYEKCMFQLFQFNSEELKKSVNDWSVDPRDFTWSLKKSYLLSELGELEKAKDLSIKSLDIIRKRIIRDKNSQCRLVSSESCFTSLINYISQAIRYSKFNDEDNTVEIIERNGNDYNWYRENKYYELLLKSKYDFLGNNEVDLEFDLDIETKTYSIGANDDDAINAFKYLRFREETGLPFRIGNVVENTAVVGVVERIVQYNSVWSTLISIISEKGTGLNYIFNRRFLAQYTIKQVDKICSNYLKVLKTSLNNVNPKNWFSPSNIFEYAAGIIPELLSRLCSRCSLEKLDEILDICLTIYKSPVRNNIQEIKKLISRLIEAYTIKEQICRLNKLCEFPIIESSRIHKYPDPVLYIDIDSISNKLILQKKEYDQCIKSLIRDIDVSDEKSEKINRLLWLYFIVEFQKEDIDYVDKLIWNNKKDKNIPTINKFYSTTLLEFPKVGIIDLESKIKDKVMKDYSNEVSKKGLSSSMYIMDEILRAVHKKIIGFNELQEIIELSTKHYDNIIKYKKSDFWGSADLVNAYLKKERDIIFYILLNELENDNSFNDNCKNKIGQYIKSLEDADISVVNLKLAYALLFNNDINFNNDIFNSILSSNSDDIIESMRLIECLKEEYIERILTKDEYLKIITLITERILFKSIDVNINIIYLYICIIKNLEFNQFLNSKNIILYMIEDIRKQTIVNEKDDINVVKKKCETRKAIAQFAFTLYKKYSENKYEIPSEICRWKEVCMSQDEFVEIRNQWCDFKL